MGGERQPYSPKRGVEQASRMQELEAKVFLLEGLLPRVARLEALEASKRPGRTRSRDIELPSSVDAPPPSKQPSRGALGVRFEDAQDADAVRIKIA